MELNGKAINMSSVVVAGVDTRDYPDFCDAYFAEAFYEDGSELTCMELDELTDIYYDVKSQMIVEGMM